MTHNDGRPSYNVPFYAEVYSRSGYPEMLDGDAPGTRLHVPVPAPAPAPMPVPVPVLVPVRARARARECNTITLCNISPRYYQPKYRMSHSDES